MSDALPDDQLATLRATAEAATYWMRRAFDAEAKVEAVERLAARWVMQPNDYDEDTEQQIEDGRLVRVALTGTTETSAL